MDFVAFPDIKKFAIAQMSITQKIHGSNAQIVIWKEEAYHFGTEPVMNSHIRAGSRTRWIYPHDDNYGFAAFVEANKAELIEKLGEGTHYGEWAGPGINSGEGLTQKTFVLFDWWRYKDKPMPPQTVVVPVLYAGPVDIAKIDEVMDDLKTNGSKLVPGYMKPEGVVISLAGVRYKKVFTAEETQWTKSDSNKGKNPKTFVDFSHLCQPIRLEKLLSRDEKYIRNYPESLPMIVKDYVADLIKENQITGDEDQIKSVTKGASGQIFKFIKTMVEKNEGRHEV